MPSRPLIALTIAGFDPSGGAGVLADAAVFAAHGLYAQAAITLLTVQSTRAVRRAQPVDSSWLEETLTQLADDNSFDCIKIGSLGSAGNVAIVANFLRSRPQVPVVLDPVLRSSSGMPLLDHAGIALLKSELLPLATWVTPNRSELAVLAEMPCDLTEEVEAAAKRLKNDLANTFFLVTSGDQKSPDDYLFGPQIPSGVWIKGNWVETRATHGTGCTLSSALAASLALYPTEGPLARVEACKCYVEGAMAHAPGIGNGPGPLAHFWRAKP